MGYIHCKLVISYNCDSRMLLSFASGSLGLLTKFICPVEATQKGKMVVPEMKEGCLQEIMLSGTGQSEMYIPIKTMKREFIKGVSV